MAQQPGRYVAGLLTLLLIGLCISGCADQGTGVPDEGSKGRIIARPLTASEKNLVAANNAFSLRLLAGVNKENMGQNVFISPLSVSMALGMTLNGAKGATADAMKHTLEVNGMTQEAINASYSSLITLLTTLDPKVRMQVANSVWHVPQLNVETEFTSAIKKYFRGEVTSIDFRSPSAAQTMNDWVDRSTNGKIKSIVPDPIPDGMVMYLINAVYFKGTWTFKFDPAATADDVFRSLDGSTRPCRLMRQKVNVPFAQEGGVQVVDLPYGQAGFTMTILLPPAGTDIDGFVQSLTPAEWEKTLSHLADTEVALFMPTFEQEFETSLKDVLSGLGMDIAFTSDADFSGIDPRGSFAISEVKHKTFVLVDEEGTEAAAVTSVGVTATSVGQPVVVRLDRPFVYAIRENASGSILFLGKLATP